MPIKTPLTALALALGLAAPAVAQEATAPPATEPTTEAPAAAPEAPAAGAETAAFSEEKLQAFVTAALEVSSIQQEATAQLQETQDEAAQATLVDQANADMVAAIEAVEGISVPEYVEIAEAAQADPALRAEIEEMILAQQAN